MGGNNRSRKEPKMRMDRAENLKKQKRIRFNLGVKNAVRRPPSNNVPSARREIIQQARRDRQNPYWTKRLLDDEEREPNRWRHTGYKEMYQAELGNGSKSPIQSRSRSPIRRPKSPPRKKRRRHRPRSPPSPPPPPPPHPPPPETQMAERRTRSPSYMSYSTSSRSSSFGSCSTECSGCSFRKGRKPPEPPSTTSSSSSEYSSSDDDERSATKMSLSERFGKMAQWSVDRKEYDTIRITRDDTDSGGMKVVIERQSADDGFIRINNRATTPDTDYAYHYEQRRGFFERTFKIESPQPDIDWTEAINRYNYYKEKNLFWETDVTFVEYYKWESWWLRYQQWYEAEKAFFGEAVALENAKKERERDWESYRTSKKAKEEGTKPTATEDGNREREVPVVPTSVKARIGKRKVPIAERLG